MQGSKRSAAMQRLLDRLRAGTPRRSAAWLGRHLSPRVTRQTVSDWPDVPEHYIVQVAKLAQLLPREVRPDLAALFDKPAAKAARCCVHQQA